MNIMQVLRFLFCLLCIVEHCATFTFICKHGLCTYDGHHHVSDGAYLCESKRGDSNHKPTIFHFGQAQSSSLGKKLISTTPLYKIDTKDQETGVTSSFSPYTESTSTNSTSTNSTINNSTSTNSTSDESTNTESSSIKFTSDETKKSTDSTFTDIFSSDFMSSTTDLYATPISKNFTSTNITSTISTNTSSISAESTNTESSSIKFTKDESKKFTDLDFTDIFSGDYVSSTTSLNATEKSSADWFFNGDEDFASVERSGNSSIKNNCETYKCNDGLCIEDDQVCDRMFDCKDKKDELDCTLNGDKDPVIVADVDYKILCSTKTTFKCKNGKCIEEARVCDGVYDCKHNEDEFNCTSSTTTCPENYFKCGDGICIENFKRCNGDVECLDYSDEIGCECDNNFRCTNDNYLSKSVKCNKYNDNDRGYTEDEVNCNNKYEYSPCFPPQVLPYSSHLCFNVENVVDLFCNIRASPIPQISWKLRNKTMSTDNRHLLSYNGARLFIFGGLSRSDAGEYSCTADNGLGQPTELKFSIAIRKNGSFIKPMILYKNREIEVKLNTAVSIPCYATGYPTPNVKWFRNGLSIHNNRNYKVRKNQLLIEKVTIHDLGIFSCRVFNAGWIDRRRVFDVSNVTIVTQGPIPDLDTSDPLYLKYKTYIKDTVQTGEEKIYGSCRLHPSKEYCSKWFLTNDKNSTSQIQDLSSVVEQLEKISRFSFESKSLPHFSKILNGALEIVASNKSLVGGLLARDILGSLDKTLLNIDLSNNVEGYISSTTPQATILVTDLSRSNITGVAVSPVDSESQSSKISPILSNKTNAGIKNASVVVTLQGNVSAKKAAFVLFRATDLFRENRKHVKLNSHVIGIKLDKPKGFSNVEIEFRTLVISGETHHCVFYDFQNCKWNYEGCKLIKFDNISGRAICQCSHLTHFGVVLGLDTRSVILDRISQIGSIFSLLGLMGIFITAAIFPHWRLQIGNKILLNLSLAIAILLSTFLYTEFGGHTSACDNTGCIALGAVMHYATLASFCWMLVTAGLQYLRLVAVLTTRPSHFLLKGAIFSWGVPIILVAIPLIIGSSSTYSLDLKDGSVCYPKDLAFLTVILPIAIVVITNFIVFCVIIYYVTAGRDKKMNKNISSETERKFKIQQLKVFMLLFSLLGLSWLFGLLGLIIPSLEEWKLAFASIFCISATLQGLILFIYFILCDKKTTKLWMLLYYDILKIKREFKFRSLLSNESTNVQGNNTESITASSTI